MTRDEKLRYHLEMVIWEMLPDCQPMTAAQVEALMQHATPDQHQRARDRALIRSPLLLDDER